MITESILKLKFAFANTPMKGLFFWEAILFLNDEEFKKIAGEKFTKLIGSDPKNKGTSDPYQNILEAMDTVRQEIATNPEVKSEVEKIREALISETAHEVIMDSLKDLYTTKSF